MRLSIPGMPGVYYDSNARSTALTIAASAAGRRAPKPQGYAIQVVPHLWAFDVDLREVPNEHPLQYFHPEGAHSLEQLSENELEALVGRELDHVIRALGALNHETEVTVERLFGQPDSESGIRIEIRDEAERRDDRSVGDGPKSRDAEVETLGRRADPPSFENGSESGPVENGDESGPGGNVESDTFEREQEETDE